MSSRRFLCGLWGVTALWLPSLGFGHIEDYFHHLTLKGGAGLTTIPAIADKLNHGSNVQLNDAYFFNRCFGINGNFINARSDYL